MIDALRTFSLGFLAWHAALYAPDLVVPFVVSALTMGAFWAGRASSALRLPLALGGLLAALLALRLVGVALPELLAGLGRSPLWLDGVPLWVDRHLTFAAVPMVVAGVLGWWHRDARPRLAAERLVNAGLLALVFWAQGPYHVTLYPVPLALGLVLLAFLLSELGILVLSRRQPVSRRLWFRLAAGAALLVALSSALWSLFGTYEQLSTASGGGLMKPDLFQFDFSPLVRLESEISLSDQLVLLYREPGPGTKRLLRRFVLSGYDPAKGFFVAPHPSASEVVPPVGRKTLEFPSQTVWKERQKVDQELFLVNLDPSSLVALNAPTRVQPYARWDHSSFVNAYRVESSVAADLYWELGEAEGDDLDDAERRQDLEYGHDAQLRQLALTMTAGLTTRYEKALAVQNWLKSRYLYSLKPGLPGPEGALKTFLFSTRKGYCSYFAFSMALLLRSLDIPARVSVGFLTNPQEKVLDFYPVRAFQAHAWVEVPFGDYGWIDFDPTSETPAPGEDLQQPKSMDAQEMTRMISEILKAQPAPVTEVAATAETADPLEKLGTWGSRSLPWLLPLVLLLAQELYRWRFAWTSVGAPPRRQVEAQWRRLRWRARQVGLGPLPFETPGQWSQRVGRARDWVHELDRARYAPTYTAVEARRARRAAAAEFALLSRSAGRVEAALRWLLPWWPSLRRRQPGGGS